MSKYPNRLNRPLPMHRQPRPNNHRSNRRQRNASACNGSGSVLRILSKRRTISADPSVVTLSTLSGESSCELLGSCPTHETIHVTTPKHSVNTSTFCSSYNISTATATRHSIPDKTHTCNPTSKDWPCWLPALFWMRSCKRQSIRRGRNIKPAIRRIWSGVIGSVNEGKNWRRRRRLLLELDPGPGLPLKSPAT